MAPTLIPGAHHVTAGDTVDVQLAQLESRLLIQYAHQGQHTEAAVRDQFQRAVQRFANARIRNFLPILIERAVTDELISTSGGRLPPSSTNPPK